jgi:hypothetical protein
MIIAAGNAITQAGAMFMIWPTAIPTRRPPWPVQHR